MRPRFFLGTAVAVIIVAACLYYFYGYHNRTISADINTVKENTTDVATTTAVKTALALNKQVADSDVHVETNNGSTTLTGIVTTEENKKAVEEIARNTKGVASVVNNLQVDPRMQAISAEKQRVTDLEIRVAVLDGLLSNPQLKTQQIKADVSNGEVKYSGAVQNSDQKNAVESMARTIANVRNVDSSRLIVTNSAPSAGVTPEANQSALDAQLTSSVETALSRETAISQPQKIKVRAASGVLYLTGTAGSKAEKALAGQIARTSPGVRDVVNNLEVGR